MTPHLRPIPSAPGYSASIMGHIYSERRGIWLKPATNRQGYQIVSLNGGSRRVHRLVLEAWIGPCPPGQQARHLDGNPRNNKLSNLDWGTPAQNRADRRRHIQERRAQERAAYHRWRQEIAQRLDPTGDKRREIVRKLRVLDALEELGLGDRKIDGL